MRWFFAAVGLTAVGLACAGGGEVDERPEPSLTKRLTGTEAAALAQDWFRDFCLEGAPEGSALEQVCFTAHIDCKASDFNERDRAWIVRCVTTTELGTEGISYYRVYDRTGRVELID